MANIPRATLLILLEALGSDDFKIRSNAIDALQTWHHALLPELIRTLESPSWRQAQGAARLLALSEKQHAQDALKRAICSGNIILAQTALRLMVQKRRISADEIITLKPLCHCMMYPHLIKAIGEMGGRAVVPYLIQCLTETRDVTNRYVIIQMLGDLGDSHAIDAIAAYVDDDDHHVRSHAARALQQLSPTDNHLYAQR